MKGKQFQSKDDKSDEKEKSEEIKEENVNDNEINDRNANEKQSMDLNASMKRKLAAGGIRVGNNVIQMSDYNFDDERELFDDMTDGITPLTPPPMSQQSRHKRSADIELQDVLIFEGIL